MNNTDMHHIILSVAISLLLVSVCTSIVAATVERQPFVGQARRLVEAMDYLGESFSAEDKAAFERAIQSSGRCLPWRPSSASSTNAFWRLCTLAGEPRACGAGAARPELVEEAGALFW
ncbi:MAG: hypothetical protein WKF30_04340 [Pyrinomonadaceae bacterium]